MYLHIKVLQKFYIDNSKFENGVKNQEKIQRSAVISYNHEVCSLVSISRRFLITNVLVINRYFMYTVCINLYLFSQSVIEGMADVLYRL